MDPHQWSMSLSKAGKLSLSPKVEKALRSSPTDFAPSPDPHTTSFDNLPSVSTTGLIPLHLPQRANNPHYRLTLPAWSRLLLSASAKQSPAFQIYDEAPADPEGQDPAGTDAGLKNPTYCGQPSTYPAVQYEYPSTHFAFQNSPIGAVHNQFSQPYGYQYSPPDFWQCAYVSPAVTSSDHLTIPTTTHGFMPLAQPQYVPQPTPQRSYQTSPTPEPKLIRHPRGVNLGTSAQKRTLRTHHLAPQAPPNKISKRRKKKVPAASAGKSEPVTQTDSTPTASTYRPLDANFDSRYDTRGSLPNQPTELTTAPYTACSPPTLVDPDATSEGLSARYEDYKYPVRLYMVKNTSYDYAQSFLEDLFPQLRSEVQKWHAHTSQGFLRDGDNKSFVVLHNATDGFEWGDAPTTTTSIAVYGRHWYMHEEIHWKTFAPDIRALLEVAEEEGHIEEKMRWLVDMKPKEKRFHRAYWLAANRLPLGALLSYRPPDEPHDVPKEFDDGFEMTVDDLQFSWENHAEVIDDEEAARIWERLLEDAESEFVPEKGHEHVRTGGTQWGYDA